VRVPDILVNYFYSDPSVVQIGGNSTLYWELELDDSLTATGNRNPYDYPCELFGATSGGNPYGFSASNGSGSGFINTANLQNKTLFAITCGASSVRESTEVEVVPKFQEI
jgi:hypothetical protein